MKEELKLMENYLKEEKPVFVKYNQIIDIDTFKELKRMFNTYKKVKFKECFEKCDVSGKTFKVEYPCTLCGKARTENLTKTRLFDMFENRATQLCVKCEEKQKLENEQRIHEFKEKQELESEDNTQEFIDNWLNPNYNLTSEAYKYIYRARDNVRYYLCNTNRGIIKDYVNNQITYKEYLSTPYWQLVSRLAKHKARFECQLCGSTENLNTHHKSYAHKGEEINYMDDLIVLCQKCHSKFHEVLQDE